MPSKPMNCPNCKKQFSTEEKQFQACTTCKWPENEIKEKEEMPDEDFDFYMEPPDPY